MYLVSKGDENICCPFLLSSNCLHHAKCIKEHLFQCALESLCMLDIHDPIGFPIITIQQTDFFFFLLFVLCLYICQQFDENKFWVKNCLGQSGLLSKLSSYSPVCAPRINTLSASQGTAQNATTAKSKKLYLNLMGEHLPYMHLQQELYLQSCP